MIRVGVNTILIPVSSGSSPKFQFSSMLFNEDNLELEFCLLSELTGIGKELTPTLEISCILKRRCNRVKYCATLYICGASSNQTTQITKQKSTNTWEA
jgi:hypothetical protein